jgi:hypothetical protein
LRLTSKIAVHPLPCAGQLFEWIAQSGELRT